MSRGWRFLVDRGGTFTDVIGIAPDGARHVRKVLSADEGGDATVRAMREITGLDRPGEHVESLRLGTTIATNALLQRRVAPTLLAVTEGFADLLEIGTQQRPDLFALHVVKPSHVHDAVVEVRERVLHDGTVRRAPDAARVLEDLLAARRAGARSVAVALVHGSRHQAHERLVGALAREAGFEHVTLSCEAAPGPGLLERAQTAVVDAALTPLLREALSRLREELGPGPCLRVMTSSGAVVRAEDARGRDAVISGPAAGAVAVARAAAEAGASQALGFDMGGTSTDVSRWSAEDGIERAGSRAVAGVRIRADMLDVVTVAAGGGSVLSRLAGRFVVGPSSAGALPGPACYGRGGPPTVTDAQVVLGRLRPEWLPSCFGPGGDAPIDVAAARRALEPLARDAGLTLEEAADACVRVADDAMAQAIRQLSVARGRDPREHALVAFGGAGPQHACGLAASMGLGEVLVPALAGVFSAHGMGVADVARSRSEAVLLPLAAAAGRLAARLSALEEVVRGDLEPEALDAATLVASWSLEVRQEDVEGSLEVAVSATELDAESIRGRFLAAHERVFGFAPPLAALEVAALRVRVSGSAEPLSRVRLEAAEGTPPPRGVVPVTVRVSGVLMSVETHVFHRHDLRAGHRFAGPAVVVEPATTVLVEPGWSALVEADGLLRLRRHDARVESTGAGDPARLEILGSAFMSIADQMGEALRRVSRSTNIKERLDYSCAVFTANGDLVANAPHVPVHLGAMGATVKALLGARGEAGMEPGLALLSNDPFAGGSHLPDVTVVSPVFVGERLAFFVANRGHHADMGGPVPGSMPAFSRALADEGLCMHDVELVRSGRFMENAFTALLSSGAHPVRGIPERLADLKAQAASNAMGARLLEALVARHGFPVLERTMRDLQRDAARATRELLARLPQGTRSFADELDDGTRIAVAVTIAGESATFDFTGTSPQHAGNLNAPCAVTTAAILYAVRCLVGRSLPLNEGSLAPVRIVIPEGSLLAPAPGAAVAGGNVETSMRITDVVLAALGAVAGSQGTMNNVSFGDGTFGYYETICGGSGAGPGFAGASAVHCHMTNTRMTDVEVLEARHPVLVRRFAVRAGSGGGGRWRGGEGVVRELELLRPVRGAILSERRVRGAFGLDGGGRGEPGRNHIIRAGGPVEELGGRAELDLGVGDVLVVETPGGGGWGSPATAGNQPAPPHSS